MTDDEIFPYLQAHFPGQEWVVYDKLFGLPMLDGVMLYGRWDGPVPIDQVAPSLINMAEGKRIA